jgi:hypothetical protein
VFKCRFGFVARLTWSLSDSCIVSDRIDTCLSIRHIGSDFFLGWIRILGFGSGFFELS